MRYLADMTVNDLKIDLQRERKFLALLRKLIGGHDEVADIHAVTGGGLMVTLKNGEKFSVLVTNETGVK